MNAEKTNGDRAKGVAGSEKKFPAGRFLALTFHLPRPATASAAN